MVKRKVIFLSNNTRPIKDSGGGNVIIYRHLKVLEDDGYEIVYTSTYKHRDVDKVPFRKVELSRLKWYPPLRKKLLPLTKIRCRYDAVRHDREIRINKGDILLGVLGEFTNYLIMLLARKHNVEYHLFFHDDNIFNKYIVDNPLPVSTYVEIMNAAKTIFVVSKPMKQLVMQKSKGVPILLYPVPETQTTPAASIPFKAGKSINVFYAGMFLEQFHLKIVRQIIESLAQLNGILTIIGYVAPSFKNKFITPNVNIRPRIDELEELFTTFRKEADVLLVMYSFDFETELRLRHSFPSKLIEYCAIGLPILIIAPPESAIGIWARENNWLLYVDEENTERITETLARLSDESFWYACRDQANQLAGSAFNPSEIHAVFINAITNHSTV